MNLHKDAPPVSDARDYPQKPHGWLVAELLLYMPSALCADYGALMSKGAGAALLFAVFVILAGICVMYGAQLVGVLRGPALRCTGTVSGRERQRTRFGFRYVVKVEGRGFRTNRDTYEHLRQGDLAEIRYSDPGAIPHHIRVLGSDTP